MFLHYRTKSFVLKKEDRGEADQIFTVFSEEFGKLEILGKGIRKISSKLRAGIDIFYLNEIEFIQGKTHKILTDAILMNKFEEIRRDIKRTEIAYKIAEIVDSLVGGEEKDDEIWEMIIKTFKKLNNSKIKNEKLEIIYFYFFWNLSTLLGYQPELYRCLFCQKKLKLERLFFTKEGVICNFCQKKLKLGREILIGITPDVIKILRIILKKDFDLLLKLRIEKEKINLLKKITNSYYLNILKQ